MPILVRYVGNSLTESARRMISAIPRNSVRVPMVTAMDGSPRRVMSTPFRAPPSAPTTSAASMAGQMFQPCCVRYPSSVEDKPIIDATERSISPVMTMSVRGSAMMAISPMFSPMKNMSVVVKKFGEAMVPKPMVPTSRRKSAVSQRMNPLIGEGRWDSEMLRALVAILGTPTRPQGACDAQRDVPVERDRCEQQSAGDGLVPERRHLRRHQCLVDRVEQECPEGRTYDGAASSEDRNTTDYDGGDYLQLVACSPGRCHRGELGDEQDPAETCQGTADEKRGEHPLPSRDACERRSLGTRSDRVQVAAAAEAAHRVGDDRDDDEDEHREVGDVVEVGRADLLEAGRDAGGIDLLAVRVDRVDATNDVQGGQGHDEARHVQQSGDGAVDRTDEGADADAERIRKVDGRVGVVHEQVAGHVGREAQHRTDGQVDVACDDDHRLARTEQRN